MASLNSVSLIGNLTRDPEIRYLPKGTAVVEFGLAINSNYTTASGEKREETTFVDCSAFARTAEIIGEYCKKGSPIYLGGKLRLETWDDKQTGQKRSKLKVVGDNIQLLGQRPSGESSTTREQPPERQTPPPRSKPPADPDLDADETEPPF